jgi:hypothetical protein
MPIGTRPFFLLSLYMIVEESGASHHRVITLNKIRF